MHGTQTGARDRAERKLAAKAEADKAADFKQQAWEPTGFQDELMTSNRAIQAQPSAADSLSNNPKAVASGRWAGKAS